MSRMVHIAVFKVCVRSPGITHKRLPHEYRYIYAVTVDCFRTLLTYTRCHQKITVIFKFRELRMFDFRIFFCYVGTHVCYIFWQYQPFCIVSLFLADKKLSRVLVCSLIFSVRKNGSSGCFHWDDWTLVSMSQLYNHDSSPVIIFLSRSGLSLDVVNINAKIEHT